MSQVRERVSQVRVRAEGVTYLATDQVAHTPLVAHGIRSYTRFKGRLGSQFSGAITYYSVLAIVPIIMLGFSALGFALVVAAPDLLDDVLDWVNKTLSGVNPALKDQIGSLITRALSDYGAIGIVGALSALYAGAGWIRNLKIAVRAQWRQEFDLRIHPGHYVINLIRNTGVLIVMLVMIAITFALAALSTSLSDEIVRWLGLDDVGWVEPALRLVPVAVSAAAGWLIFLFLYTVLPETRAPWKDVRRAALIGAIGLGVLQYLTTFLIGIFAGNPATAVFGPIITVMLFFNLFARLILLIAAWIGTADHPAEPDLIEASNIFYRAADLPVRDQSADAARTAEAGAPSRYGVTDGSDPRGPWSATPGLIPEQVATKSVRAGSGIAYLAGAATGLGAGSALARLFLRRR